MAVYFDHRAQAPYPGQNTDIEWHQTAPLLAVASHSSSTGGCVNLYREEGEYVQDGELRKSRPASVLAWHPTRKILAVGWETGELTVLNEQEQEKFETPVCPHKSEITILHWTSNGTRLLSGDATGVLVVWKADTRGRLQQQPLSEQNLQEQITKVVLKPQAPVDPMTDIASLARAAVSGDESALDMFNWKKGKTNMRMTGSGMGLSEAVTFYIGGMNGSVYYLNENGAIVKPFTADSAVRKLLYYQEKNILITMTTNMMLTQHSVSPDGDTRELLKVKLSGKSEHPEIIWAGKGILATCTNECVLRMWDLDKEENYILNLEGHAGYDRTESITCISFCHSKKLLAGGTDTGHIAVWKYAPSLGAAGNKQEPEDRWKLQPPSVVSGPVSDLAWGSSQNLLAVNTVDEVYVLCEQIMSAHCCQQTGVVQTGPMQLSVDIFTINKHADLKADIQIKGIYTTKESIAIWDSRKLVVYEIPTDATMIKAAGTFTSGSQLVCLYEQNAYTLEPGMIQVRNFQGTVKQLLNFTEMEGEPVCMDVCSNFLVVGTSNGYVKMFDVSRREAKMCNTPRCMSDVMDNFGSIVSTKCNCNGSKVSIIGKHADGNMNPKIYIWDTDTDMVQFFNFATGRSEQDEYISDTGDSDSDTTAAEKGKNQAAKDIAGRFPTSHHWDAEEMKLLVCETKLKPTTETKPAAQTQNWNYGLTKPVIEEVVEEMVVSLFVTPESGVLIQDNFAVNPCHSALLAVQVPYFFFAKRADMMKKDCSTANYSSNLLASPSLLVPDIDQHAMVSRRLMRDFVGLENADKLVREAMMNFSYYLTIGNMDEAFKAIKLIKSESVWENMAKMCVKTRRLDVAAVCLGNMKHARGAKALREALKEPELDARVGVLAMQLGLNDDGERLFKNCQRYDLLNNFYQCQGDWGKALETAEMYDRVHLRSTYYNYAKYLESQGDLTSAVLNYEKSDTHRFEVPRMLIDDPAALEGYVMKTKDKALKRWWAQFMESTAEMETALQFYQAAQDILSLVRVYCYCSNMDKAAEICNETGDRAACYHLARQYEGSDQIREAVHFFTRAGAYGSAIRLCKDNGLEDQLINLAFLSRPEDMVEAARYYEFKPGSQDKAVTLYHKAGHFSKALDLAFETKQFAALQMVSEDLDEKTDPELLRKCADFFIDNGQFDRAVDLLAVGKKYWEAMKICMEQRVLMTEELVEKLTPPKEMAESDPEERIKILNGIAEVCMQQGQHHLATKKYTQAGNKVKAMKALLKSGDTDKIIFFAGVSRQKEIYVMAANYLQSLDWRKDPNIMKNIISFYTKGRALDSLSSFYDACAQVEVDEYQNYDKALGALSEAYKCLAKAKMTNQSLQEEKLADLKHRITLVKKFAQARRTYEDDADEAIKTCQVLLQEPHIDTSVRIGDVYGFMVEHFARKEKWRVAFECMEEMHLHLPKANMAYYINIKTIEAIHHALNIPMKETTRPLNGFGGGREDEEGEGEGEEEVEEDVVDEIFDN